MTSVRSQFLLLLILVCQKALPTVWEIKTLSRVSSQSLEARMLVSSDSSFLYVHQNHSQTTNINTSSSYLEILIQIHMLTLEYTPFGNAHLGVISQQAPPSSLSGSIVLIEFLHLHDVCQLSSYPGINLLLPELLPLPAQFNHQISESGMNLIHATLTPVTGFLIPITIQHQAISNGFTLSLFEGHLQSVVNQQPVAVTINQLHETKKNKTKQLSSLEYDPPPPSAQPLEIALKEPQDMRTIMTYFSWQHPLLRTHSLSPVFAR
ncbi:MAG: hypothetical protein ACR2PX_16285 [Endozoicomonas sp.]